MTMVTMTTHVGQDGTLKLDLPQFKDADVEVVIRPAEVVIRPASPSQNDQRAIFDIPSLVVDPNHPALRFLSREELYDDDGLESVCLWIRTRSFVYTFRWLQIT